MKIHPRSKKLLESLAQRPSQAILLSAPIGYGLLGVAMEFAAGLTAVAEGVVVIEPEKTGISIDQVRELYRLTRTRTDEQRVVVLRDVEQMSHAAQTAFLKLLEEPTTHTIFLLLSEKPENLLATIHSRVQAVELLPITTDQSTALLDELRVTNATMRKQLLFIANGLPSELARLVADSEYQQLQFTYAAQAKELLAGALGAKLLLCSQLSSNREQATSVLRLVAQMLQAEIYFRPTSISLLTKLERTLHTLDALATNGNLKAQLLRFVVSG